MRAFPPARHVSAPLNADALSHQHEAIQRLLEPLLDAAKNSEYLVGGSAGEFAVGHEVFQIPRFVFMGPKGGGDTIRLGIFAALHGDEPEGVEALVEFLQELQRAPETARGYHVYAYPVCNPAGFVARTRGNASGEDVSRHFWHGSSQPEGYYLERELGVLRFQGVISLQTEDRSSDFIASTKSIILNLALVQPAIQAPQQCLPGSVSKAEQDASLRRVLCADR
jgi:hypothetical protein